MRAVAKEHLTGVVACEWIKPLAWSCLNTAHKERVTFEYDLHKGVLYPCETNWDMGKIGGRFGHSPPFLLVSDFDPSNRVIRMRCCDDSGKEMTSVYVEYQCDATPDLVALGKGSIGFNHAVLEELEAQLEFRIVNVATFLVRTDSHRERRSITMLGTAAYKPEKGEARPAYQKRISRILSERINEQYKRKCHPLQVTDILIKAMSPYRLFISAHNEILTDYKDDIEKLSTRYGCAPTISWTLTMPVTARVLEDLQTSDALVQIVTLRENERPGFESDPKGFIPNLGWLLFELGVAKQLNIKVISIVDTHRVTRARWRDLLCADADRDLVGFDATKRKAFPEAYERAMDMLTKELRASS